MDSHLDHFSHCATYLEQTFICTVRDNQFICFFFEGGDHLRSLLDFILHRAWYLQGTASFLSWNDQWAILTRYVMCHSSCYGLQNVYLFSLFWSIRVYYKIFRKSQSWRMSPKLLNSQPILHGWSWMTCRRVTVSLKESSHIGDPSLCT